MLCTKPCRIHTTFIIKIFIGAYIYTYHMMEKVIQFLKSNVIGKVLFTDDIVYKLDNGNLEGIYRDIQ